MSRFYSMVSDVLGLLGVVAVEAKRKVTVQISACGNCAWSLEGSRALVLMTRHGEFCKRCRTKYRIPATLPS